MEWQQSLRSPQSVQVGDILVMGDRGAHILVQPQLADFLCEALTSVHKVLTSALAAHLGSCATQAPGCRCHWLGRQADGVTACARSTPSHQGHKLICCTAHAGQVRSVSVQPRRVPLAELRVAAPRLECRTSVEASMRLDALASAGFRVSRSVMTDLIKKGDVRCVRRAAGLTSSQPLVVSRP